MSAISPEPPASITAWQRYAAKEHAARDAYLAITVAAHREYLMGPWPDRAAYEHVERSAWVTYYAAGREAWRVFTAEVTPPPPPPTPSAGQSPAAAQFEQDQHSTRYWAAQPGFTPNNGGTQLWPPSSPVISANKRPRW